MTNDSFGSGADDQRFGQLFAAADSDHGKFGRKSLDVVLFFVDKAARDQQRKCYVLVSSSLESPVQRLLDIFPERPTVRPDDHAAADRRIVGELRFQDQLVVPLGEILGAGGELFFSHAAICPVSLGSMTRGSCAARSEITQCAN